MTDGFGRQLRVLFCLPTTALSGGVKVIFEIANRMVDAGHVVELFSYAGAPKWTSPKARLITEKSLSDIDMNRYDFVFVSNAFFLPLILPLVGSARAVFFCQDWESFHHADGTTFADYMAESPTFVALYQLPVPIITVSRAVQALIKDRAGKDAYYVPVGLNKEVFTRQPPKPPTPHKRVLMVGNYLMPYKGMRDGFDALRLVSRDVDVQLVLVTQEYRNRQLFDEYEFPIEFHFCPTEAEMPSIMASCDAYCCTSWYEGLGLPALEAFRCGVAVVSTRTYGVSDYGVDDVNLLLAQPHNPVDLSEQLRRLLTDDALADRLRTAAFKTVEHDYDWSTSFDAFLRALLDIDRTYEGATNIDPSVLSALSRQLEMEGNFTPIETFREFYRLATATSGTYRQMLAAGAPTEETVSILRKVRDELRPYVANPAAEYFRAFKAEYDRCQLVLSLIDDDRFAQYLDKILSHGRQQAVADASSRPEPRHTHR